jgi:predicted Zn-ribbon and HTH transcriptional regulator
MVELANYIPELDETDLKMFLENIEHELTQDEINEVREWAFRICKLKCFQCGHEWVPRIKNPRMCAKCHSVRWDKPNRKC